MEEPREPPGLKRNNTCYNIWEAYMGGSNSKEKKIGFAAIFIVIKKKINLII